MIRNINQILADLDKHASEFNFPVLDEWLVVFEVLGYSTREISFVNHIYAFGSCVQREGFFGEEIALDSSPKQPLFDAETNECIADWSHWSVKLGDETLSFSPSPQEYAEAGIEIDRASGPGSLREFELLRFLIHKVGEERLFLNDQSLLGHFPHCRCTSKFIQTTKWQHPDIADGEKPSRNISISSLIEAFFKKNPSFFDPGQPNTDWKSWPQAESEE